MDVPERIWIMPARDQWERGTGEWMAEFWGLPTETPYILATPAALAASPEGQALIREAEARGMERVGEFISGSWILPSVAKDRLLDQIRAAASAIRKVEETPK